MIVINILLLILGFILLIKGADFFVDGASSTAQNFKVSKMLIGLTIVAFGTSAPELAVSISSLLKGSTDMVLGNVIGSNILNILLILGIAAVIRPINIKSNTVKKELPLTMLISTLLVVLFLDINLQNNTVNQISKGDGIVLLLFFSIFLYYLLSMAKQKSKLKEDNTPKFKLTHSIFLIILGLIGIILGSEMEDVKEFKFGDPKYADLTGINNFKQMESLNLEGNWTVADLDLSGCENLKELNLNSCGSLRTLNLSGVLGPITINITGIAMTPVDFETTIKVTKDDDLAVYYMVS